MNRDWDSGPDMEDAETVEPTALEKAVAALASVRLAVDAHRDALAHFDDDWNAARKPYLERVEAAKQRAAETEALVRKLGEDAHAATGDKHPHPAVEVITRNPVVIPDEKLALGWAEAYAGAVVEKKLNRKAFDNLVKTGVVPADVARVEPVTDTRISSDLSKWL